MKRGGCGFVPGNASRIPPKGEFLPIPLLCSVTFGAAIRLLRRNQRMSF
jgi:hypothetical protein